jgi:hypothetical protein
MPPGSASDPPDTSVVPPARRSPGSGARGRGHPLAYLDLGLVAVVAAFAELAFDRVLPAAAAQRLPYGLLLWGAFCRHFSAILCVFVLAYTIGLSAGRRDLFGAPARMLLVVVGMVLTPLLAWAAIAPMPAWLSTQVESSFIFFALACVYTALRSNSDTRTTAGVAVLTIPLLARGYALAAASIKPLAFGRLDASQMAEHLGEAAALVGGIAAPFLLPPRVHSRRLGLRGPLTAAFVITGAVGFLASTRLALVQSAAAALGFALPDEGAGRLVYLVAVFGTTWTAAALLTGARAARLVGSGLALVAISGYSLRRPSELAAMALGLLLITWGETGAEGLTASPPVAFIDPERWLTEVRALAARLGGECVLVNDEERQITRLSGKSGDHAVVVRIVRERGVDAVEIAVGTPPADGSEDLHVDERPGAGPGEPFERRFRVRVSPGSRGLPESARAAFEPLGGTMTIWTGRGARWRQRLHAPAPLDRVPTTVEMLARLI